jgi:hypothetical protein
MKTQFHFILGASVATAMVLGTMAAHSAPPGTKSKADSQTAGTNVIPQSTFTVPTSHVQGRDPFFPNSSYMSGTQVIKISSSAPVTLILNGLSGTSDHRLAMINGHTFAEGEDNDIQTASGRVRIHCIQIKGDSVVVEVGSGGERRELRLRE